MSGRAATPKLWVFVVAGAAGLVAAVASGRPEPAALAAPLLVAAAIGVSVGGPSTPTFDAVLGDDRLAEGDLTSLQLVVGATEPSLLLVAPVLPVGLRGEPPGPTRVAVGAGDHEVPLDVRATRWGAHRIPGVRVREMLDPLGLLVRDHHVHADAVVRVYPAPRALRRMVAPLETSLGSGSHVARAKGPGVEFADIRPYVPGDRVREVNWRATARGQVLWVNERHPDRSADVVVFLDAFVADDLPRAVPAADAVVRATLRRRDRVGLVSFGGTVRWVRPGAGLRQQYLVVDALLATAAFASAAWRDLEVLPPRVLPPAALVLAVSSLRDERGVAALWDLRARGADLAVLEVDPSRGPRGEPTSEEGLAGRLWELRREVTRDRFRAVGVPVARWAPDAPLAAAVEELTSWPRARPRR